MSQTAGLARRVNGWREWFGRLATPFRRGAVARPESDDDPSDASDQLLFICLRHLAATFGRPSSSVVLASGLPGGRGALNVQQFTDVCSRLGIETSVKSSRLAERDGADCPGLVWRSDGRPALVVELEPASDRVRVFLPETGTTSWMAVSELQPQLGPDFLATAAISSVGGETPYASSQGASHWLYRVARNFWRHYSYIIMATVFINLMALALPLFIMNVYDRVLPNRAISTLWVLAIGVLLVILFDYALKTSRAQLIDHVARRIDLRVSNMVIDRVLNTRLKHQMSSTGTLMQRLSEYEFLREFLTSNTVVMFIDLVFGLLFIIVIFSLAPMLALYPLLALVFMVAVGLVAQRLIGQQMQRAQYTSAHRQSLLVELISGLEAVKSMRAEGEMLKRWDVISKESSLIIEKIKRYSAYVTNTTYSVAQFVSVAIIVNAVYLFDGGNISTGAIIASVMLASRAVAPLGLIAMTLSRARHAMSALKSLDVIMAMPDERDDPRYFVARTIDDPRIEFRNVRFAYGQGGRKVLDELSLTIAPGERVAILGRVGVGKTTLGRLLVRFYDTDGGEILVGGIDIRQFHPHEIRRAINFVGQDADLFNGSLRENLVMAAPDASDEEIVAAARLSGIEEFVAQHPMGYEAPVGERGSFLSSGQRQMVGLARALLGKGRVLFLDDPTSSMDMATERIFISRLKEALRTDQTLIVTTHRNAVLSLVNRVVVIDRGKVVADGPVEAVLRRLAEGQPARSSL